MISPARRFSQAEALRRIAEHLRDGGTLIDLFNSGELVNVATGEPYSYRHMLRLSKMNLDTAIDLAAASREELRAEKRGELAVLKIEANNPAIEPEKRVDLKLKVIDRECKLDGLDAPTRTVSQNTNVNLDVVDPATLPEYRRWLHETRFMDAATKEKVFQLIRDSGLNVRVAATIEVPDNSPLWDQPQLEEGKHDAD